MVRRLSTTTDGPAYKGQKEWTIFSYPVNATVFNSWKEIRYTFKPDFIFYGKPEGVKYYEKETEDAEIR